MHLCEHNLEEAVRQCVEKGLVSGRLAVTDSTHVKANASRASEQEIDVPEGGNYWELLDAYDEEGLEELKRRTGKRRAKRTKQIKKGQAPFPKEGELYRFGIGLHEAAQQAQRILLPVSPDC